MFKFRISLLVILSFITTLSWSQPFSLQFNSTNKPNGNDKPTPALSAEDFKTSVNQKSQRAQQELFQQTQNNLKQQASQMPLPNPPPKTPNKLTAPNISSTPNSNNGQLAPAATTQKNTADETAAGMPPTPTPAPAAAPASESSTPPISPADNNSTAQPYTGFGTGGNSNSNSSSTKDNGWSIKY